MGATIGHGDQLMAAGMAKGANARGRRIAFGDKHRIIWDQHSADLFRGNPNVAKPGSERDADIEWVAYYKGHRIYNRQNGVRWDWNYDFKPIPGEVFFDTNEIRNAKRYGDGFVLIEPNLPAFKSCAPNKDWGLKKYQKVADALNADAVRVAQFVRPDVPVLNGVERFKSLSFRDALGIMAHSKLYVGPEGGLHHGAAAVGKPAVVLFGGFIPPQVTGYDTHINLTGGAEACGSLKPCKHCRQAMAAITADEVLSAIGEKL